MVLVVTEARRRLTYEDAEQLRRIRLAPDPRVMPDLLLADVGVPDAELRLIFLECVATAGAMTQERVTALRGWLDDNRFGQARTAFGTVFRDRSDSAFRRHVGALAWGTFVWCVSEPESLLLLLRGGQFEPRQVLGDLIREA